MRSSLSKAALCLAALQAGACATYSGEEPVDPPRCEPRPVYPADARRLGIQGDVEVRFHIDTAGRMRAASVTRSSGHPTLDQAAMAAIDRTVCSGPAVKRFSREPVEATGRQPVSFRLHP